MGIHDRKSSTQCIFAMDRLWPANGASAMALGRDREAVGCAQGHLLYAQDHDVPAELRAGRLGYT